MANEITSQIKLLRPEKPIVEVGHIVTTEPKHVQIRHVQTDDDWL